MGWDLEIDIHAENASAAVPELIRALTQSFGDNAKEVTLSTQRAGDTDSESVATLTASAYTDIADQFNHLWTHKMDTADFMLIEFNVDIHDDAATYPRVELYVDSTHYRNPASRGLHNIMLTLGNHNAYRGRTYLASGMVLDDEFLRKLLLKLCVPSVDKLTLVCEQNINYPINHHFAFRRTPKGFTEDIVDIVQISLHGGSGYSDSRADYDNVVDVDWTESMMLGDRPLEWGNMLVDFLSANTPRLEPYLKQLTTNSTEIEDALLTCDAVGWDVVDTGFAIYGSPVLDQYCEDFYVELMERLVTQLNP